MLIVASQHLSLSTKVGLTEKTSFKFWFGPGQAQNRLYSSVVDSRLTWLDGLNLCKTFLIKTNQNRVVNVYYKFTRLKKYFIRLMATRVYHMDKFLITFPIENSKESIVASHFNLSFSWPSQTCSWLRSSFSSWSRRTPNSGWGFQGPLRHPRCANLLPRFGRAARSGPPSGSCRSSPRRAPRPCKTERAWMKKVNVWTN